MASPRLHRKASAGACRATTLAPTINSRFAPETLNGYEHLSNYCDVCGAGWRKERIRTFAPALTMTRGTTRGEENPLSWLSEVYCR
jgi:hypothetical protein